MSELLPDKGYEGSYTGKESMEAFKGEESDDERMGADRRCDSKEDSVDEGDSEGQNTGVMRGDT